MQKIYTTIALLLFFLPQLLAKNYPIRIDSLVKNKPDSVIKAQRDSVLAPPVGFELRKIKPTYSAAGGIVYGLSSISTPTLLSPLNYNNVVYGSTVSFYWTKNNNANVCDYYVKVVDLTSGSLLYNYTNVGDVSSFEARNLIAGHTYSWLVRAVNRSNSSDFVETAFSNFSVSNTNTPTLSITSISGTTFCGNNRQITINYNRTGNFNAGNIYFNNNYYYGNIYVELSNKNGDFINPTFITGIYQSANSGSFSVTLPENLPFSQNYKIRIFSFSPIVTSEMSGALTIGTIAYPNIVNKYDVSIDYNSIDLCTGNTALIRANVTDTTNVTFQWRKDDIDITSGGNFSKYKVTTGGRYKVAITQGTCPTVVSQSGTQVYTTTGGSTSGLWRDGNIIQCTGGQATLTMPYWADNQTYKWYKNGVLISGETQRTYTATQSGTYSVKSFDNNGCSITATSDPLIFGSSISINSSLGASTICITGGQTSASVSAAYSPNLATTYQWKRNGVNISGATSSSLSISQEGVYNAEVVQGGCTATSQGLEVKASTTLDSIKILQSYPSFCSQNYIYLSPSTYLSNASYRWKNTGITVNTGSSHTAIEDGSYTLTVTQGSCSTTSKPVAISLNTKQEVNLYLSSNSSSIKRDTVYICPGTPQSIYASNYPSGSYQWFKNNVAITGATSSSYYTSESGSYTLQITTGSCTLTSKPLFVENTFPKFSLNATPQNLNGCTNNIYTLDLYDKGFYPYYCTAWKKDGQTINTCTSQLNAFESGIYTAVIRQGTCSVETEPLKITIGEPVTATISGSSTISAGSSANVYVNFTGASPWTFTLSDGTVVTTSKNPYMVTVSPTATKTYTISSVVGSCGTGTASGSATVTIGTCNTPTTISSQPLTQTKCTGSTVTLSVVATGGGTLTYQWKKDGQNINGANTSTLTISSLKLSDLGNYTVAVTGTCGMVLSNTAILKVTNDVPFYVTPASVTTTSGSNVYLQTNINSAIGSLNYSWQGPNGFTSNSQNPTVSNITLNGSGVYTAFVSNTQGCSGQSVASITVLSPSITINSVSSNNFCSGQTGSISFTPSSGASTTYAVQLSYSDGSFSDNPTLLGSGSSSPISFTLPSYNSGTTNSYKLRIIDTQNSTQISSPSSIIYFNYLYTTLYDIVGSSYTSICSGSAIKLYANTSSTANGTSYEWQKDGNVIVGATGATYTTNQVGSYKVKATVPGCGTATSSTMNVSSTNGTGGFYQYPESFQCAGISVELKSRYNSETSVYTWQKDGVTLANQNTYSLTVTQSGVYSLTVSDGNCYYTSGDSKKITFGNTISAQLYNSDSASACTNYGIYLSTYSNKNPTYSYQWKKDGEIIPSATDNYYFAFYPGVYSLKVTQGNCSSTSKSVVVKIGESVSNVIKIYGSPNICSGSTPSYLYLTGLTCGSFQWQKDQVDIASQYNTQYFPTETGSYRLKITNGSTVTYTNAISIVASNTATYNIKTYSDTTVCNPNNSYYLEYYTLSNPTYQWYKDNSPINGATLSGYNISSAGVYKLKVTLGSCVGYSQDVNYVVRNYLSKPILVSNQGSIVCNNNYTYLNTKYELPNFDNLQWKKDGVAVVNPASTYNSSYDFAVTQSGSYTLKVFQGNCSAESDPIKISVGEKQQSIKTADWNNTATWSCGTLPTITEAILINKNHVVSLPNNITGFVKNLELQGSIIQGSNAKLKFLTN